MGKVGLLMLSLLCATSAALAQESAAVSVQGIVVAERAATTLEGATDSGVKQMKEMTGFSSDSSSEKSEEKSKPTDATDKAAGKVKGKVKRMVKNKATHMVH